MADRKLSALTALTAPSADDELYIIDSGVPKRIRMDDMSIDETFTPTIGGSTTAGVQTYTAQNGYYSRIGNIIIATIYIVLSAKDAATAGDLRIFGLPFSSNFSYVGSISLDNGITLPAASIMSGYVQSGSTEIRLYSKISGGGALAVLNSSALSATSNILFTVTYRAS
jgi:hypothetical protein